MMKKRNPVLGIKTANILNMVCKTEDVGSSPAAMLFGSDFPSVGANPTLSTSDPNRNLSRRT